MEKTNSSRKIIAKSVFLVLFISMFTAVSLVSAYTNLCLTKGQSVPSKENPIYTCRHDLCQLCVNDNNYPTLPQRCKDAGACKPLGGEIDKTPPKLTINSPVKSFVYNSRKVVFDLTTDEISSIYYTDALNGRGRWKKLCINCKSYNNGLSFRDGLNDIIIKAVDKNKNSVEIQRQFYIDSKKPKITKANVDYQGGYFVEFKEENPTALLFHFGNSRTGYQSYPFNINTDCQELKGRYSCEKHVSFQDYISIITPYNEQTIDYWFELIDIAGNSYESKKQSFYVDITPPLINNPTSFWRQGQGKDNKYIYFNISITEDNFDEVSYIDNNDRRPSWRRLCNRLKDRICEKRVSFRDGDYILDIQVTDKAGNAVAERFEFEVL